MLAVAIRACNGQSAVATYVFASVRHQSGVSPREVTMLLAAAHWVRSRLAMAAAIRSGNRSGVQAKAGEPMAAKAAAFWWSYIGAPSSVRASSDTSCTPDARIGPTG